MRLQSCLIKVVSYHLESLSTSWPRPVTLLSYSIDLLEKDGKISHLLKQKRPAAKLSEDPEIIANVRMLTFMTPPSLASATANSWWMSLATIFFKTFLRLLLILPSTVAVAAEDENKQWLWIISIIFLCFKLLTTNRAHFVRGMAAQWGYM